MTYNDSSLINIEKTLSKTSPSVTLDGNSLSIAEILSVARHNSEVSLTKNQDVLERISKSHNHMISDVKNGIPVYGANTGLGGQAGHIVTNGTEETRLELAKKVSDGIVHTDVTTGPPFDKDITRGAMAIRINMLMKGVSGVKIEDLQIYKEMLNKQVTPIVGQYGGIGASGDLAHNCRVLSAARQLGGTFVWDKNGNKREAKDVLAEERIQKLILDPKAGLGLINGDNFSTSLATQLAFDTLEALMLSFVLGAMFIEVIKGTNRSFHPMLAKVRQHPGQKETADVYRYLLEGSKLAYMEMQGHVRRPEGVSVQDAYSARCISQFQAVSVERIKSIFDTITINANSTSDNPLWVPEDMVTENEKPWQWVSGGNFLAMHMAESMDSLRKIMTHIVKLMDRHLARIIDVNENNGLPANLSDKKAITQCAFKGVQIQSGMFDVYSSLLSMPVTTFFGVHEENNQDITSHALTSGIFGLENLRLTRYSLAQQMIALSQAADLRGGGQLLSPKTRPLYEFVRSQINYTEEERPLGQDIELMNEKIKDGTVGNLVREKVFPDFG